MSKSPKQFIVPKASKIIERGPKVKAKATKIPKPDLKPPKAASFKPQKITIAQGPKQPSVSMIKTTKSR